MHDDIKQFVDGAQRIVIIQADNPDADSLGSALALEQILHEMGKEPYLYCGVDMPEYLRYLSGWDRVNKDMPTQFDASIIVDTSAVLLLGLLEQSPMRGWVASRPSLVLDHHAGVVCDIPYTTIALNEPDKVSTGELIYSLATSFGWPLNLPAKEFIATSILADSMGLSNETTTAQTYRVMAELVDGGVSRPKLEELRRAFTKMPPEIFRYKAELIRRTEFASGGRLAVIVIPQEEISEYSPLYNPNPLIQGEHLQTKDVLISVAIKTYSGGRITAAIRCNIKAPIASKLAEHFGGGGHAYASGFKIENGRPLNEVKSECIRTATDLLNNLSSTAEATSANPESEA
jgi:phosphoesterase RecJ-like protein